MKDTQTNIRLSDEVKKRLEIKAKRNGMTVSEYIRYLINKDLETE
jgi:predicted DNA-binding protein